MIEDKLTRDERIRLECFAQAVNATGAPMKVISKQTLFNMADEIEKYIRGENENS